MNTLCGKKQQETFFDIEKMVSHSHILQYFVIVITTWLNVFVRAFAAIFG